MPSKPAKYGIKSWVACDAKSSYAWKMQVYTGKPAGGGSEKNQGMRVVLDVTEGLKGCNVTCDNFFTSYELGQQLLKRDITMVGTVRKNKPELPPALLLLRLTSKRERERERERRRVLSSMFAFTPTTTLVSYLAKRNKNVLLLSTLHKKAEISDREDRKPAIVLDYNCNKGGVDNLDKVIGTYSCRRMTVRWPLVIFHNIVDVSSYNAFVIWREINPDWMARKRNKRRFFLEQLGKALVTPLIERRERLPRTEASAALVKAMQRSAARSAAPEQPEDHRSRHHHPHHHDHHEVATATATAAAAASASAATSNAAARVAATLATTAAAAAAAAAAAPAGAVMVASKRKRCQVCPPKKDCKTQTVCCRCNRYICKGCALPYCPACANNLGV